MPGKRDLSAEERALWDRVSGTARRLAGKKSRPAADLHGEPAAGAEPSEDNRGRRAVRPKPAPPAKPVRGHSETEPPAPTPGPLDRRTEQRLKRGRIDIDARLDLHGMTQRAAYSALRRFLVVAQARGWRLVLVITGKGGSAFDRVERGWGAEPRGVLRRIVPQWLAGPDLRPLVAGYRAAHLRHGGEGALYVQIRRARS